MLYIFAGLPGTGKSALAKYLSQRIAGVYLRVDTIEQTLKNHGINHIYDQGYQVAFSVAFDNLKLGQLVVADSTNLINESRASWRDVATKASAQFIEIEVICSDQDEHKQRVDTRISDIPALQLPTWQSVIGREYHQWDTEIIVLDTAGRTLAQSKSDLLDAIGLSS